eukprot:14112873-Alexandrium_andersonii.AAC.1
MSGLNLVARGESCLLVQKPPLSHVHNARLELLSPGAALLAVAMLDDATRSRSWMARARLLSLPRGV